MSVFQDLDLKHESFVHRYHHVFSQCMRYSKIFRARDFKLATTDPSYKEN